MTAVSMTTTPGGDMGDLARAARWAQVLVDAALPLDAALPPVRDDRVAASVAVIEEDRAGMRLEAFSQLLAQLIEGGWTVHPSDLERMMAGDMPAPRNPG